MSHYGNPPEPPEDAGQTPADPSGAVPPPSPEKPWSPYPDNWDDLGAPQQQPASPYGQPAAYPALQQQPGNPYAGTPAPAHAAFAFGGYASWGSRVVAYLIDGFLGGLAGFPAWIAYVQILSSATTTTDAQGVQHLHLHPNGATVLLLLLGAAMSLAFFIWNQCLRQGRTGATLGKSLMAIRVVHSDMEPIGGGMSFVRYLLNIVNGLPCYLGYLWPLWDSQNQTFADKIMSTYVIKAVTPQPRVY